MSLEIEHLDWEINVDMRDLKLSKYGLGFKLKSFTTMLSWTGMTVSVFGGLSSLIAIVYPLEKFYCSTHDAHLCGFIIGIGVFWLTLAPVWFTLSFQLRKNNIQNDLIQVTKLLKIFCCIQGALAIISCTKIVIIIIILNLHWIVFTVLLILVSSTAISVFLMIIGVVMAKPKLLAIFIFLSMVLVILYILFIIGYSVYLSIFISSGLPFILGLISSVGITAFSVYWHGFVVTFHTIMKIQRIQESRNLFPTPSPPPSYEEPPSYSDAMDMVVDGAGGEV